MSQFPGPPSNQPISSEWSATCGATPLTSTTPVTIKDAAGAGLRNYITGIQLDATSGQSTIQILDNGTVIFVITVGASGGSAAAAGFYYFPTPLRSSANTPLTLASTNGTTPVYWNAQGYVAP